MVLARRDLSKITYRIHQQRERLAPSLELRKAYLTSVFHGQIKAEKDNIAGYINRMQPGVRRVYLEHRLQMLNARAGQRPLGL